MKDNPKMEDIAEALGISIATVSRSLNGKSNVHPVTKKRVIEIAETMGYHTNLQPINFRHGNSKLIGLILPQISRFFIPDLISAVEEVTKKKGYNLVIFQSKNSLEVERQCAALCESFRVDGLLVSLSENTTALDHFRFFAKNDVPVVYFDRILEKGKIAAVKIDDFSAAYQATKYLAKNSVKISGVFNHEVLEITKQRKKGFIAALKEVNLRIYEKEFCFFASSTEEAYDKFTHILNQDEIPDAVFVMTDDLLVGVTQAIYKHPKKLEIGKDIAIVVVSNGYLPNYLSPNITYIKHSGEEIGKWAIDYLMDLIDFPKKVQKEIRKAPIGLIVQGS